VVVTLVRVCRLSRLTAGLTGSALVAALEQACVRLAETTRFACDTAGRVGVAGGGRALGTVVFVAGVSAAAVVVLGVEAELGLDGGGVDAVGVKATADGKREFHVASRTLTLEVEFDLNVQAADKLGVTELPDVDVVARHDAREVFDVGLDVVHVDAGRDCLKENARCGFAEGNCGGQDNGSDDEGDGRVHVEAPAVVGEPDEESGGNNADVSEGIAQDVKEDTAHVEVAVVVATLGLLLGLSVSVLLVIDRLALGAAITCVLALQKWLVRRSVGVSVVFVIIRALFRMDIIHAACCDNRLAESTGVDMNVVES